MIQRKTLALIGISGLLLLGACGQDTSAATADTTAVDETAAAQDGAPLTEAPLTEAPVAEAPVAEAPVAEAPDPALAAVEAGRTFYAEQGCANCHVEGVDDVMAPPSLRAVDADSLLAFLDGTAPHSGGAVEGVREEDAATLEAFLATL